MKTYYLLLLSIGLFGSHTIFAQSCPTTGFSNGSSLFFFYSTGSSPCEDRPLTLSVDLNEFSLVECENAYTVYDISSGTPLANPNMFLVDFGYATCEYTNGVLTNQTLSAAEVEAIMNTIKVYPNPIIKGDYLNIKSPIPLNTKVDLFDVSGKRIMTNIYEDISKSTINVGNLPNGIYFLKLEVNNLSTTKKLVIMK